MALPVIAVTTIPLMAQNATTPRARRVAADVSALADDSMGGRKTCQPGNVAAAAYIGRALARIGARPFGDDGGFTEAWTAGSTSGTREAGIADCRTANVLGILPGRGTLAGQYVIVGAHFDHLGTGRFGSLAPDSGQIHNGADDNASGVAAVLEIARIVARDRQLRDNRPRRAVVFALWSGEEEGSLGSAWYAGHLPMAKDSVAAYLNFDMVGRLHDRKLIALGSRTAAEWPALLDSVNASYHLDLRASGDGWGPSDHASFYAQKLPVLHFFTDLHTDYHRPSDDAALINADGIVTVADFAGALLQRMDRLPGRLTFVDVPPPAPPANAAANAGRPRPSLGTIPDMASEPGGVLLSGVRTGSAADSAGMRAGDVLVGIGADSVGNLQDFQNALMSHNVGDSVEIRYKRGTELIRRTVRLGGRAN
jgi:hypothetical protein